MEEFEKWVENKEYTWCGVPIDKGKTDEITKRAWKAALKWVKRGLEFEYNSASDAYIAIKEELGDRDGNKE